MERTYSTTCRGCGRAISTRASRTEYGVRIKCSQCGTITPTGAASDQNSG